MSQFNSIASHPDIDAVATLNGGSNEVCNFELRGSENLSTSSLWPDDYSVMVPEKIGSKRYATWQSWDT